MTIVPICRTFFVLSLKATLIFCIRHNINWLGINILLNLQEGQASVVYDGGAAQTDVNKVSCERS